MRIKTNIKFGDLLEITDGPQIKIVVYYPESGNMEEWVFNKQEVNPTKWKRARSLHERPVYYTRSVNNPHGKDAHTEIMVQGYEKA